MIRRTFLAIAATTALSAPAFADAHAGDIVAVATEAGSFSTLLAAAEAAGLVETLQGEGPFTVFAPTDDAFAALPEGTVDTLLMDENQDQLVQILTLHVVPGTVMSGDLSDGMMAGSVEGSDLTITSTDSGFAVNGSNIVQADIEASNGVIHVIDAVILPSE
ncbi:MAG: fasciclin domain-containing protein [Shimia sp.]